MLNIKISLPPVDVEKEEVTKVEVEVDKTKVEANLTDITDLQVITEDNKEFEMEVIEEFKKWVKDVDVNRCNIDFRSAAKWLKIGENIDNGLFKIWLD